MFGETRFVDAFLLKKTFTTEDTKVTEAWVAFVIKEGFLFQILSFLGEQNF